MPLLLWLLYGGAFFASPVSPPSGQLATILLGWCLAQYPNLIYPDLTIRNASAPESTLRLLVIALGLGVAVLLPSLYYLFHIFKGRPLSGAGD